MTDPGLEGIENFRDFGGVTGRFGRVRPGLLFRSAQLTYATDGDLAILDSLDLGAIVDLRRRRERRDLPSRLPPGFTGAVFGSDDETDGADPPHLAFLRQDDRSDAAVARFMLDHYRTAPFDPRQRDLFGAAFRFLDEGAGAMLIHCAAGKDRTGLLAALVGVAVGVHPDDLRADYARTNASMMTPSRLAVFRPFLRDLLGVEPSDAIVRATVGVDPHHLDIAFDAIEAAGGIDAYLVAIGADAMRLERIRARAIA